MRCFALIATLFFACMPVMASAQSGPSGGSSGGERPDTASCPIGATACVEQQDSLCRGRGGRISLRTVGTTELSVSCGTGASGRGALGSVPPDTRACTAGTQCHCRGSSQPGYDSVYICMNQMINECLSAGGKAAGLGIYPDVDNDGISVATGTCVHR